AARPAAGVRAEPGHTTARNVGGFVGGPLDTPSCSAEAGDPHQLDDVSGGENSDSDGLTAGRPGNACRDLDRAARSRDAGHVTDCRSLRPHPAASPPTSPASGEVKKGPGSSQGPWS